MEPTIPVDIALALPIAGELLAQRLMSDRLAPWQNALIAAAALIIVAILCLWLSGNITGNVRESVLLVIAYCAVLMRGSLNSLSKFFADQKSPLPSAETPTDQA